MRWRFAVLVAAVLVAAVGCSAAGSGGGAITVEGAWARPSMGMERAGAAYMVIRNGTDAADALVGASSPAATTVEIHETTAAESGAMAMHPVERIELPAGGSATLEPGGYHLMLIDLTGELMAGETIEVTLEFEQADPITVTAEVRAG